MRRIDELFPKYPFYGSRQMVRHLWRAGVRVGRHRARRLMRVMGLQAIYQAPRTTTRHPEHRVYPYLLKGLAIERPNQVWTADITYIPVQRGFLYLVAVMDRGTRQGLSLTRGSPIRTSAAAGESGTSRAVGTPSASAGVSPPPGTPILSPRTVNEGHISTSVLTMC